MRAGHVHLIFGIDRFGNNKSSYRRLRLSSGSTTK